MLTTAKSIMVAGLEFIETPCPKCKRAAMFKRACPCRLNRQGWATCAQCAKCGTFIGLTKKKGR